jgi:hypothetical protein
VAPAAEGGIVFATSKGISRAPLGEGRFPHTASVLPKGKPLVSVPVDPEQLVRLLKVAAALREDGALAVVLHFWPGKALLGVTADNPATGQAFDGLMVPLSVAKP